MNQSGSLISPPVQLSSFLLFLNRNFFFLNGIINIRSPVRCGFFFLIHIVGNQHFIDANERNFLIQSLIDLN